MLRCKVRLPRKLYTIEVDLMLENREFFCLFGPSASGKTSILSAIAGFEAEGRTQIVWDDEVMTGDGEGTKRQRTVPPWRRGFAYVTQHSNLFPHLTVRDNLVFSAASGHRWTPQAQDMALRFGLAPYLSAKPSELSGGLAQRANLARALLARPRLLLLDEPLSALDETVRREMQDLILEAHKAYGLTTILVTHQLSEAQRLADRIALLDRGHILQIGSPATLMESPASETVARLMGYTQWLDRRLFDENAEPGWLAIHPDRVRIGSHPADGIVVSGRLMRITPYHGSYRAVLALQEGQTLEITVPAMDHPVWGEIMTVTLIRPVELPRTK